MNIPNFLSLFRLVLVPCFAVIYMSSIRHASVYAGAIFLIAALTDIIDGYIARMYDKITKIGRILDPLADKLLQLTALACLSLKDVIPLIFCYIFIAKELLMIVGGMFMVNKLNDVMPSNLLGKILTFLMSASIAAAIFFREAVDRKYPDLFPILFGILAVLAIAVLIIYAVKYILCLSNKRDLLGSGLNKDEADKK
jgi:cardiolipin synthase